MNDELKAKLERFRTDYAELTGQPFDYFYCPILYKDEKDEGVSLCQGHVVNQAFRNTDRTWTVQRTDVDNFYGSFFEADFSIIQDIHNQDDTDIFAKVFADQKLYRKLTPKILLDGNQIDHFFGRGHMTQRFTPLVVEQEGQSVSLGLKMSPDAVANSTEGNWEIEISKDIRIAAMVSLIKAAHLTLFEVLGYRYTFSAAGEFVGHQILGTFFRQNRNKSKSDVLQNAYSFFREFVNMVRPIQASVLDLKGTITDKTVLICWGSGESAWGMIVIVKIGTSLQAVMLPASGEPNMIATFLGFMQNQNESISVSPCQIGHDHWTITQDRTPIMWPKTGFLYP